MEGPRTRRSLTCEVCSRTFARPEHLRRHLRTHTKEKPYVCSCGRSFARKDLLTRHERLSHPDKLKPATRGGNLQSPEGHIPPQETPSHTGEGRSSREVDDCHAAGAPQESPDYLAQCQVQPGESILASQISGGTEHHDDSLLNPLSPEDNLLPWNDLEGLMLDLNKFITAPEMSLDWNSMLLDSTEGSMITPASDIVPQIITPESFDISSRIPDDPSGNDDFQELKPVRCPWLMSEAHRRKLVEALLPFGHILSRFALPSRLSLARYLSGYVDGFSDHQPFIHIPTLRLISYDKNPELMLSIFAIGAQYRYEKKMAHCFYQAARSIVLERLRRGDLFCPEKEEFGFSLHEWMHRLRTLLLLATWASWQDRPSFIHDAFEYQSLIARCIREAGASEASDSKETDWITWAFNESDRRAKFFGWCLLNLHGFAFDIPPSLLGRELNLYLPSSCREWTAQSQAQWAEAREQSPARPLFKAAHSSHLALSNLSGEAETGGPVTGISPMGNYILIHALLQRIYLTQQLSHDPHGQHLPARDVAIFEQALSRWRHTWRTSPESILDLNNPYDSLSFTSTALLGAAHIRLHCNLAQWRDIQSCDPITIAATLREAPPPRRGPQLIYALLHSVHALNIPVQIGISYLSHCKSFSWSFHHALCNLECATFLSKWLLLMASATVFEPLTALEQRVIRWISRVVREALFSHDETIEVGLHIGNPDLAHVQQTCETLGYAVIKVWAQMFKQCNSPWPIVNLIGRSLDRFAELVKTDHSMVIGASGAQMDMTDQC